MEKQAFQVFQCCRKYTIVLSLMGLALSYYSIVVSDSKTRDSSYTALCDISETISCSNVLTSFYSKGFGLVDYTFGESSLLNQSNGFYGLIFYTATLFLSLYPAQFLAKLFTVSTFFSLMMSAYLCYILIYVLQEICIVCISTYLINCILCTISVRNQRAVKRLHKASEVPDYSSYLDGRATKKRV